MTDGGVHWLCSLAVFTGCVHWLCSLAVFTLFIRYGRRPALAPGEIGPNAYVIAS